MSQQEPPKIEFPCQDYPIKVLGETGEEFVNLVHTVMNVHAGGYDISRTRINVSSKGTFQAVTVFITATGVEQLQAIHDALRHHRLVRMVM